MATRRLRSFVSRLVLVAGLATTLVVGSVAVGGSSGASAMPRYTCTQAMNIALMYLQTAYNMDNLGYTAIAQYYYGKHAALADVYYPCGNWGGNGE